MSGFDFSKNKFAGALALNAILPTLRRAQFLTLSGAGAIFFAALAAICLILVSLKINLPTLVPDYTFFLGLSLIFLAPFLFLTALEGFANSQTNQKMAIQRVLMPHHVLIFMLQNYGSMGPDFPKMEIPNRYILQLP